jgi:predicted deacylase
MIETRKIKIIMLVLVAIVTVIAGIQLYQHRHYDVPIVAGPGVTKVGKLSDYHAGIKGTIADTDVFFMEGEEEGGSMLVICNTHSNEIVAGLTAFMIVENAVVEKGRLIVIPQFNNSGGRNTRSGDGYPLYFDIDTPWGSKTFRMGNRDASPLDQWPDPDVYVHYPEGQLLSYMDVRNTNRTWPGRPDGPLMEQVCFAAMELIRNESIDATIDVHGAETMFPVTNCVVAPDKSMRIATMTALTVKSREGFDFHVEPSPAGMRGLSHREIGDYSDSMPFLLEAPLPFLDQPTGPKTMDLLLTGKDPFLLSLSEKGMLFVPYDEEGWPIERRAGQHTSVILELMSQMGRQYPEKEMIVTGIPKYSDVVENGIGYYLTDPSTVDSSRIYYQ